RSPGSAAMWFCVFPSTEIRRPDRDTAPRTRSTVLLLTFVQSSTVLGLAHIPMDVKPSFTAKSRLSSLKLPRMPSFGFHGFVLAAAAAANPPIRFRRVIYVLYSTLLNRDELLAPDFFLFTLHFN